jgi:hypothetical protein
MIPDLSVPHLTASDVVIEMIHVAPPHTSLTADAWFANLSLLERYSAANGDYFPLTFGLSLNSLGSLYDLFTYNLAHHEIRVFARGLIVVSVWHDEEIVIVGSNAFSFSLTQVLVEGARRGPYCLSHRPTLSLKALEAMKQFDTQDIHALVTLCGISPSKNTACNRS